MFAAFLGFWATAAIWELVLLGILILACVISSAGTLWRWERGNAGEAGWAYAWLFCILLVVGSATIPEGSFGTLQGFLLGATTVGKYVLEYLAVGLTYGLVLLGWMFIKGRSALAELVTNLKEVSPLDEQPSYYDLKNYAERLDGLNDSNLFTKYFFGQNAFFKLENDYKTVKVDSETRFKLIISDVSVLKGNVFQTFLDNMFLWAALLPARIFMDWLVDFGRWVVETVSKFGLNYVKSALKT